VKELEYIEEAISKDKEDQENEHTVDIEEKEQLDEIDLIKE